MNVDQPQARAALGLIVALAIAAWLLRWGFRDDGRPRGYKGRHRAPEPQPQPDTESSEEVEHEGATEAYADELHALAAIPAGAELALRGFTPPEGLPTVGGIDQMFDDIEADIEADTRRTFDRVYEPALDKALTKFGARIDALLADWADRPAPTYDRSAARDEWLTAPFETVTGPIDVTELRRELAGAR